MAGREAGFLDVEQRLRELSERGESPEKLGTVEFEIFRAELVARPSAAETRRGEAGLPSTRC